MPSPSRGVGPGLTEADLIPAHKEAGIPLPPSYHTVEISVVFGWHARCNHYLEVTRLELNFYRPFYVGPFSFVKSTGKANRAL